VKLEDLARRAGVSPRTVRYYIQRGLLAAPEFRGPDTRYGEIHLATLRALRALQDQFWPLEAIAAALEGRSLADLHAIGDGTLKLPSPTAATEPARAVPAPKPQGERGVRYVLAEGVELFVREGADPHLVQRLLATTHVNNPPGGIR